MVFETINSGVRLRYLLMAMLASAVFIAADAGKQYFTGVDFIRGFSSDRLSGPFSTPNGFAAWLIMLIPIFLGGVFARGIGFLNWKLKTSYAVIAVVLLACVLLTYTRGAWLGLGGSLLWGAYFLWGTLKLKTKWSLAGFVLLLLIGGLMASQRIAMAFERIGDMRVKCGTTLVGRIKSSDSAVIRIKLWTEALSVFEDFPLIGSGLNAYSRVAAHYKVFPDGGGYPHNSFLQMAAETGLFGLSAFLWILFEFFRVGWRHVNKHRDFLTLGLMCGILAFVAHSFVETNLYSLKLVVLFWFMLGLASAVMRIIQAREGPA